MFLTNRRSPYIFNNIPPHPTDSYRFLTNEIRRSYLSLTFILFIRLSHTKPLGNKHTIRLQQIEAFVLLRLIFFYQLCSTICNRYNYGNSNILLYRVTGNI